MQSDPTTFHGPTFIRLLARLAEVDAPRSNQALPDRLSQWLDWTHALALSSALDGKLSPPAAEEPNPAMDEHAECARVRAVLAGQIAAARELADVPGDAPVPADDARFRQRYVTLQRSMQASTGRLRGRLRDALAAVSTPMARLAEVDAVMELALSPREQALLSAVPGLLGKHFERLRASARDGAAQGWLDVFRRDMRNVLLAELDVRFQPVEGLLAALRNR